MLAPCEEETVALTGDRQNIPRSIGDGRSAIDIVGQFIAGIIPFFDKVPTGVDIIGPHPVDGAADDANTTIMGDAHWEPIALLSGNQEGKRV